MKIIIKRNEQKPEVTIDLKDVHYPNAIRESIQMALEIDGFSKETIAEVFNQSPDAKCEPSEHSDDNIQIDDKKQTILDFLKFAEPIYWGENEYSDYRKILDLYLEQNGVLSEKKKKCDHYKEEGGCKYKGVCPIDNKSEIICSLCI